MQSMHESGKITLSPEAEKYVYYRESNPDIIVMLGDCAEIMPLLPQVDLVVTDPPYGIDLHTENKSGHRSNACKSGDYEKVYGDDKPFDPTPFLKFKNAILFGANHYASRLPDASNWLVWDKREGMKSNDQSDVEMAWTNFGGPARLFNHRWCGMIKASEQDFQRQHPTQKPIHLMKWCIQQCKYWDTPLTILDPFGGSCTTAVACKELKKDCIIIEINEKYCEIGKKRLQNTIVPFL